VVVTFAAAGGRHIQRIPRLASACRGCEPRHAMDMTTTTRGVRWM